MVVELYQRHPSASLRAAHDALVGALVSLQEGDSVRKLSDLALERSTGEGVRVKLTDNERTQFLSDVGAAWSHACSAAIDVGHVRGAPGDHVRALRSAERRLSLSVYQFA
jgi:hypothetical protein